MLQNYIWDKNNGKNYANIGEGMLGSSDMVSLFYLFDIFRSNCELIFTNTGSKAAFYGRVLSLN